MKEEERLTATDPYRTLDLVREKMSSRQLRLSAVACCRTIWPLLTDVRHRSVVVALRDGHRVALFFSDRPHAGENLAEVLQPCTKELPPPIQM